MQSKKANEQDLRREFEMYGAIERVRIVRDKKDKSRGYAFIVYERERDMKGALPRPHLPHASLSSPLTGTLP